MSRLRLATSLPLCCTLALASACKGGGRHHDSQNVEPIEAGGAACPAAGCADAGEGPDGARLQLEVNNCPRVALDVTPVRALLDQPIRVTSRSEDADGDALRYEWLAEPDGDYTDTAEAVTDYLCESLGRKTLQLVATDAQGCEASAEVEVSCVPAIR